MHTCDIAQLDTAQRSSVVNSVDAVTDTAHLTVHRENTLVSTVVTTDALTDTSSTEPVVTSKWTRQDRARRGLTESPNGLYPEKPTRLLRTRSLQRCVTSSKAS
jgi:hypothetical protein